MKQFWINWHEYRERALNLVDVEDPCLTEQGSFSILLDGPDQLDERQRFAFSTSPN